MSSRAESWLWMRTVRGQADNTCCGVKHVSARDATSKSRYDVRKRYHHSADDIVNCSLETIQLVHTEMKLCIHVQH